MQKINIKGLIRWEDGFMEPQLFTSQEALDAHLLELMDAMLEELPRLEDQTVEEYFEKWAEDEAENNNVDYKLFDQDVEIPEPEEEDGEQLLTLPGHKAPLALVIVGDSSVCCCPVVFRDLLVREKFSEEAQSLVEMMDLVDVGHFSKFMVGGVGDREIAAWSVEYGPSDSAALLTRNSGWLMRIPYELFEDMAEETVPFCPGA